MKHKIYMATLALGALASSCADEFDQAYSVAKPKSLEDYAYLADYKPLRDYVTNPNFKLGGALEAGDFNSDGAMHQIAATNFNEIVAGNAMKMSSCVDDKGNMNFTTVSDFVNKAEVAGVSVFGHTLAWHAQQPKKWLEEVVLADKPVEAVASDNPCIIFTCAGGVNAWDQQGIYDLPTPMEKGKTYVVKAKVKTDDGAKCALWPIWNASDNKNEWGGSNDVQYLGDPATTKSFSELTWEFEASFPHDRLQFVFGLAKGDVCIDDVSCKEKGSDVEMIVNGSFDEPSTEGWSVNWNGPSMKRDIPTVPAEVSTWNNILNNSDCEGTDGSAFYVKNAGESNGVAATTFVDGGNPGKCVSVTSATRNATGEKDENGNDVYEGQDWDAQFWIVFPESYPEGTTIKIKFDYKASQTSVASTQAHGAPGAYHHWSFIGDVNFTTEWKTYEKTVTIDSEQGKDGGCQSCAFNLSVTKTATTYYFDNIEVLREQKNESSGIPQTAEEKKDTLTWALDRWIGGMMKACKGKVKAWDVVNEAVSGADKDGDGFYDLQHGSEGNTTDFFWQDYLGDIDYVRTAVASARKHFAANGGNAADLKLFINDYSLESTWDYATNSWSDNKKLKSLINWIAKWEADGTTKIDGIGTQMHVTYSANAETQAKQEEGVVKMLELMAATGKLVRISELDMGYNDANGIALETSELTEEQHKQMAAYYSFIVRKYLEIVPAAQQYGITQWCLTDSPATSAWRPNAPTGLWDLNYDRKHTYAGFAEGLQGKEYK
ncbi:MAG: endo-1,4-beta-xylanase [Bacteroidales bacterium]|jgi:GH35 family endo-1,4-beta-xylanase|nr:endo-1,4-beta-xylanase [Bacteroidales bacterium]